MTDSPSPYKSSRGIKRLFYAGRYSAQGLAAAFKHEAAFRQELAVFIVLCPLALWLDRTPLQKLLLIGSMLFVLVVELLNSAVETVADALCPDHHPLIGRAKDIGSAAVMVSILTSVLTWLVIILCY